MKPLMPVNGVTIRPTTGTPPMSSSRPWITLTPKMSGTKWIDAVVFCSDSSSDWMRGCEVSGNVMNTSLTPCVSMKSGSSLSAPTSTASSRQVHAVGGAVVEEAQQVVAEGLALAQHLRARACPCAPRR